MKRIVVPAIVAVAALVMAGVAWAPWETMSSLAVNDVTVCRNATSYYLANFEHAPDPTLTFNVGVGFAYTVDSSLPPPDRYSAPPVAVTTVPLPFAPVPFPDGADEIAYYTGFSGWVPFSSEQDPNAAAPYDQITLIGSYPDTMNLSADKNYDIADCYLLPMSVDAIDLSRPNRTVDVTLSSASSPVAISASDLDPSTIQFGAIGGTSTAAPVRAKVKGSQLLLRFRVGETGITCDALTGRLTGQLSDGRQVIGTAELTLQPCQYP